MSTENKWLTISFTEHLTVVCIGFFGCVKKDTLRNYSDCISVLSN